MRRVRFVQLVAVACALAACAPAPPLCVAGDPALNATLYFGRSRHDGGAVSDAEWSDFLARSVTPRFPDGLTVLDGHGQWRQREAGRVVAEPSTMVVIVTDPSAETRERLEAVRAEYRARFGQDSVGLVTNAVCAAF